MVDNMNGIQLALVSGLFAISFSAVSGPAQKSSVPDFYKQGPANARYTLELYADLECPFCRDYYPSLLKWAQGRKDLNLEWRNLPLNIHDPVATKEAEIATCAGFIGGRESFWETTDFIFKNSTGNGGGLPASGANIPGIDPVKLNQCVASARYAGFLRQQIAEAQQRGITDTPSLIITDHGTGRTVILAGPADENVLLSALDSLNPTP